MKDFNYRFRKADFDDHDNLKNLYLAVSQLSGGIARNEKEITSVYINHILTNSINKGLIVVSYLSDKPNEIVGSVHAYRLGLHIFRHVLSELTIVVHPDFQRQGIGKELFSYFLNTIKMTFPSILRVELMARESNKKGLSLYKQLGFKEEGRLHKRVYSETGHLEDDLVMAWFNPNFIGENNYESQIHS